MQHLRLSRVPAVPAPLAQLRACGECGPGWAGAAGVLDLAVDPAQAVAAAAGAEVEVLDARRLGGAWANHRAYDLMI